MYMIMTKTNVGMTIFCGSGAFFPLGLSGSTLTRSSTPSISFSCKPFVFSSWRSNASATVSPSAPFSMKLEVSLVTKSMFFAAIASGVAQRKPSSCFWLTFWVSASRSAGVAFVLTSTLKWVGGRPRLFDSCASGLFASLFCSCSMRLRIISAVSRSAATTTMRLLSFVPRIISMVGRAVTANISAGMKKVMITKERERTRSRYSRLAIMKMLCIGFAHRIDEYFFQRRLHQLKLIDPRFFRHHVQQLLRVGARRQADLNIIAVVVIGAHQRVLIQEIAVAFILDLHIVLAIAGLDGFQVALQHRGAFVDQANAIAQFLHLVHAVR